MWTLGKEFTFEASHRLPFHDGKCGRLHGHSWKGIVYISGKNLETEGSSTGMVLDYSDIKKHLSPLIESYLDHYHLNESLQLESPTSEEVARWIYKQLEQSGLPILGVQINETCTSRCLYTERINLSDAFSLGGTVRL